MMMFLGFNLIPENLETGEFVENATTSIKGLGVCYVLAYSRDPAKDDLGASTSNYNGIIVNSIASGLWYYIGNMNKILEMIQTISDKGFADSIVTVFSVPSIAIFVEGGDYTIDELDDPYQVWGYWINNQQEFAGREFSLIGLPSSLNGYTPRNQKLRTYPYCYLGYNPSNGSPKIFRYENFGNNNSLTFKMISELNPNPTTYFIPYNYKGETNANVSESVSLNGYPSISYHTDYFNSWMAQNSNLINLNLEQNKFNYDISQTKNLMGYVSNSLLSGFAGNLLEGNIGAGLGSLVGGTADYLYGAYADRENYDYSVKNQMAQIEQQQMLPNSASLGGTNTTLLGLGYMNNDLFTKYSIKSQFAQRIDKYFDMYGYETDELKLPNLTNRPNWNYIKTLGINIIAKIPQEDLQSIKNLFDNGITLWHNPNTFLDYSQNNR